MQLQLIRNATMRLTYAGKTFLLDPMFAPAGVTPGFASERRNPLVEMPLSAETITANIDAVMVTHLHPDHFDPFAQQQLDKALPLICTPDDSATITDKGFSNLLVVDSQIEWQGVTITRTAAQHGYGAMAEQMAPVSGFVLQADGAPTIYWCSDSVWFDGVADVIERFRPTIIITHSGGAYFGGDNLILMDVEQTVALCQAAPDAQVIAVHLESLDHCTVSRAALRSAAAAAGLTNRLHVPDDGQTVTLA